MTVWAGLKNYPSPSFANPTTSSFFQSTLFIVPCSFIIKHLAFFLHFSFAGLTCCDLENSSAAGTLGLLTADTNNSPESSMNVLHT